uniref:Uncharacterized protein LOC111121624 n=1 Tax=Crassostrea virginica TaxID=6565 RepID=A0A8B8CS73_CRAVI|nr:uncharacterized protein LOC111121624 [Crassostrea virginica]
MESREKAAWSLETYTIHDVVYKMGLPRTVRVTEGVYSHNEHESLSTGDIIRLEAVSELKRVTTRASLMDGDVTDLQIPLTNNSRVYVYTGTETVYKSVQELIHLFPGFVHVDSPIKVVTLNEAGKEGEEVELAWGSCLKLEKVASGQGLHCTCGQNKVCLRPFQRGRFSRIPKNDILSFQNVIKSFSLPVKVRFLERPPELSAVLDTSQVNYFSLERVESEVAIVGIGLRPDGTSTTETKITIALTQANDVEVQVSLKGETPSMPTVPKSVPTGKEASPSGATEVQQYSEFFWEMSALTSYASGNQASPGMGDNSNVASVNPTSFSGGKRIMFGSKLPVHPPRKMSNPETFKEISQKSFGASMENKLCAVPPLPARTRTPSDEALDVPNLHALSKIFSEVSKKTETALTLNKLPPELGKQLFNSIGSSSSNSNSKASTPTKPMSNRSSVNSISGSSSDNDNEAEYISMESTRLLRKKPVAPPIATQQNKHPTPRALPNLPPRNRGSNSSQNTVISEDEYSAIPPNYGGDQTCIVGGLVMPFADQRMRIEEIPNNTINEGVVSRHAGTMLLPKSSHNLDEFYSSIPRAFRQSLVLVHKEFFTRQFDGKPTGAVSPMARLPAPVESNFSTLSVAETARCFRECRLNQLADLCEKEALDGCFIDKMTPEDLSKEPFNLTVLHRMKVEQIKNGWRPNCE